MKEDYRWNYNIKIKTKDGTFEYEKPLEEINELLDKHKNYEEIKAKRIDKCKKKVLKKH